MKRTLHGVTEATLVTIQGELKKRMGISLESYEGVSEVKGFKIRHSYDPAKETLEVEVLSKPWFVPQKLMEQKVDEFLRGPQAASFLGSGKTS